ncbi:MAG: alpha/beta hydrolase [Sulfuritalea sp.]|nr:alpha/beta hydrolase [Sulfuritalea sp.]
MNGKLARMLVFLVLVASLPANAADQLLRLETRPEVTVPVFYMKRDGASATVILLPGGNGGFGALVDGKPSSRNFVVRSRDFFIDAGFNVAVMSRPSDKKDLDYADRVADEHLWDIRKLVDTLKADSGLPVWLVGTSRGTVSATAAAISFGNTDLAGIVLTSSVVSYSKVGAVPKQDLAAIRIPVLVVHHEQDGCSICRPDQVPAILDGLKQAPFKKLVMLKGGGEPKGDPCKAMHHHGFVGMEKETVTLITNWIKQPAN